jgi:hypothetical protein
MTSDKVHNGTLNPPLVSGGWHLFEMPNIYSSGSVPPDSLTSKGNAGKSPPAISGNCLPREDRSRNGGTTLFSAAWQFKHDIISRPCGANSC